MKAKFFFCVTIAALISAAVFRKYVRILPPMNGYIFESERFRFRELTGDDAQFGFDLNSDPEVIQYTGDPPFASVEEAQVFMDAYTETYRRYRCGRWGMELKETGGLVRFEISSERAGARCGLPSLQKALGQRLCERSV
jgi:RimJ/RimL family protein N-acetyltransferase